MEAGEAMEARTVAPPPLTLREARARGQAARLLPGLWMLLEPIVARLIEAAFNRFLAELLERNEREEPAFVARITDGVIRRLEERAGMFPTDPYAPEPPRSATPPLDAEGKGDGGVAGDQVDEDGDAGGAADLTEGA